MLLPEDQRRETLPAARLRPPWHFDLEAARRLLTQQFGTRDLAGFGAQDLTVGLRAAGALLQYARDTQKAALPHIRALSVQARDEGLQLDAATRRNLELDRGLGGNDDATLFALLNRTSTAMGSRELRRWLNRPLRDRGALMVFGAGGQDHGRAGNHGEQHGRPVCPVRYCRYAHDVLNTFALRLSREARRASPWSRRLSWS